jgi:hypothetical protein
MICGECWLLIASAADNVESWSMIAPTIAKTCKYQVVAIDLPGALS